MLPDLLELEHNDSSIHPISAVHGMSYIIIFIL